MAERLNNVQAVRGMAALAILLHHCSLIFSLPKYWGVKPFGNIFDFGHAGVEFFFVLSGFIIFHVHVRNLNAPAQASAFLSKRFLRICPIYWTVLALMLGAFLRKPILWQRA